MPSDDSANDAELKKTVRDEFDKAEKALKRYERVGGATLVAAINQLRYVGRHIIDAEVVGIGIQSRNEHYRKAICHCHRAAFDAREATVIYLLDKIQGFTEPAQSYDIDIVTRFIPDYLDRLGAAAAAQQLLVNVGSLREAADQSVIDDAIAALLDFWTQIRVKRGLIVRAQKATDEQKQRADEQKRTEDRRFVINFLIGIGGILFTICLGVAGLWFIFNPPKTSVQPMPDVSHVTQPVDVPTNVTVLAK